MIRHSWWQRARGGRKALALVLPCLLAGIADAPQGVPSSYRRVSVERVLADPPRYVGTLVLTSGRYEPIGEPRRFLEGVLVGRTGVRLRLMGPVFDWVPQAFSRVEVWGRVQRDGPSLYLDFFNGRPIGQTDRRPYVMPPLAHGSTVTLVAKLRQVGSDPFVHWVLETEDRRTVEILVFPPEFQPMGGLIVEATGVVRAGGVPPVIAGLRIEKIKVLPGPGPSPFGG